MDLSVLSCAKQSHFQSTKPYTWWMISASYSRLWATECHPHTGAVPHQEEALVLRDTALGVLHNRFILVSYSQLASSKIQRERGWYITAKLHYI